MDLEVSYDIEWDPDEPDFLHGLLTRHHPVVSFRSKKLRPHDFGRLDPVLREPRETPSRFWQRFLTKIEELNSRGEYAVYVYSHHEGSWLKRLADQHGGSKSLDRFRERIIDLYAVLRATVICPRPARDLKTIANYAGFKWRGKDPSGLDCVQWWTA